MRISIPTIPDSVLSSVLSTPVILPEEAAQRIASFLSSGNVALLTGAGVSVDSGIRAYRGKDGRYMNPNYKYVLLKCENDVLIPKLTVSCLLNGLDRYLLVRPCGIFYD